MGGNKISTGSYDFNKWLFGGYENDVITTIYGPAGSGKTNFCLLVSVSQAKKGNKVIYIDTEGGFSIERFKQMAGEDYQESVKNILLMKPVNFLEQKKVFDNLLEQLNNERNIGAIVVDSIAMLYRLEIGEAISSESENNDSYNRDEKIKRVNRELARQLRTLVEISRNKNIPIIVTNQVYYSFNSSNFNDKNNDNKIQERIAKMVGGDLLKYWSKCLIELKNENNKRTAVLTKHRSLPEKELSFIISNEGIKKKTLFS